MENMMKTIKQISIVATIVSLFSVGILLSFLIRCPAQVSAAELDIGLIYSEGVTSKRGIDSAFTVKVQELNISGKIRYTEQDSIVSEDKGSLNFGWDPALSKQWSLWFFERPAYDKMRMIDFENYFGGGVKYLLIDAKSFKSSISAGILQHSTKYETGQTVNLARFSLRPKVNWAITTGLSFQFVAFYQPAISALGYLIDSAASLRYALTKRVGLKLKVEDSYRSVSITDKKNDFTSTLVLSIKFGGK